MGAIDFLSLWVKDIAIVFVLISIIEIILPNNNMKKYIDMIIGFLIIIVIISPLVKLLHRDFNINREIFQSAVGGIEVEYKDNLDLASTQEEQVKEIYIRKIEGEIRDLVHENTNYKVEKANILISEDETKYGNIKNIELILKKDEEEEDSEDLINVANIEEISIGNKKDSLMDLKELEDDQVIKNLISKNHNISKENIKIFLNTLGEGEGELDGEVYR